MLSRSLLALLVCAACAGCKVVEGTAHVGKFAIRTTGKVAAGSVRTAAGMFEDDGGSGSLTKYQRGDQNHSYTVRGRRYHTMNFDQARGFEERGIASWYGREGGPSTSSGERYRPSALTAAHKTLPLGSKVRVTNLRNGRSVTVRINDRGPFVRGRVIDCSRAAADRLEFRSRGVTEVHIRYLGRS
ncbi:MAG: septal ring lytic transglycosylase RlpA family protein [Verrucomicrobiota bacterium]